MGGGGHGEQRSGRPTRVVVGAAIIADGRVLACARSNIPATADRWEFPGGKVEAGETDQAALARECAEELAVRVEIGARVGPAVPLANGWGVLRVYRARLIGGTPRALEHAELRWLAADELDTVGWLPADAPIVEVLRAALGE